MRPNKREAILKAEVAIIDDAGPDALTYESLAARSGFSKSGLVYHFPSREELMLAIHAYLAESWEQELLRAAGVEDVTQLSEAERLRAVVLSFSTAASLPELLLQIEAVRHPEAAAIWRAVDERWMPKPATILDGPTRRAAYLVQLMADGLFLHDHLHVTPLTREQRAALTEAVLQLIPTPEDPGPLARG
ncbi:TetR/AcrR family transcriptional regulator [Corynebacterium uropygiale]|uniref:TetR/AcrR family transcriptional regulator n=1 Tax=Corynebacterium uropygiale TaxID=1775911 RepID=A0A9X1QQ82_9CORY|nr:TetR/AcrR family transcriptional regulator [Corynebacterium uropygiale]MCF4007136.1 TetR/AcrR family transcriptional regulator [Corynebacterium uropygiale]